MCKYLKPDLKQSICWGSDTSVHIIQLDSFYHMILIANIQFYEILTAILGEIMICDDLHYDDANDIISQKAV